MLFLFLIFYFLNFLPLKSFFFNKFHEQSAPFKLFFFCNYKCFLKKSFFFFKSKLEKVNNFWQNCQNNLKFKINFIFFFDGGSHLLVRECIAYRFLLSRFSLFRPIWEEVVETELGSLTIQFDLYRGEQLMVMLVLDRLVFSYLFYLSIYIYIKL